MDGTPGTSQLFASIQFDEAKKGYDREQVTNFLKELSTKIGELQDMLRESTARAETAEVKAAEAVKAKVLAEALADKAKAEALSASKSVPVESVNEVEAATGMLALAQQTGEAAIAAAELRAKDVVADARSKAAMIVVEVEQEVERIKVVASEQADSLVAGRVADVDKEVARLTALRDELGADVDSLSRQLAEHRERIRIGVETLTKLLEGDSFDPPDGDGDRDGGDDHKAPQEAKEAKSMFDTGSEPEPSSADADADAKPVAEVDVDPPAGAIRFVPEPDPAPMAGLNLVVGSVAGHMDSSPTASRVDAESERRAFQIPDLLEAPMPEPGPEPQPEPDSERQPEPEPDSRVEPVAVAEPVAEPVVEITQVVIAATGTDGSSGQTLSAPPSMNLTAAKLFGESAEADATRAFDVLGEDRPPPKLTLQRSEGLPSTGDSSPLGEPDADADAAMREFFERDLATLEKGSPKNGRFLRRK